MPSVANPRDAPAPKSDGHGYTIREQPMGTKRPVRVILMGAGASSLNFFYQAERHMTDLKITCYEKNHDIVRLVTPEPALFFPVYDAYYRSIILTPSI